MGCRIHESPVIAVLTPYGLCGLSNPRVTRDTRSCLPRGMGGLSNPRVTRDSSF
jgi:hypothetical protein